MDLLSSSSACKPWLPTNAAPVLTLRSPASIVLADQAERLPDSKLSAKMTSVGDVKSKLAVTDVFAVMVTVQVPVPEQPAPLQLVNVDPEAAVAVSVTTVLILKELEQVEPQLMPAGLLVTVPLPVPVLLTVNVGDPDCRLK